MINQNPNRFLIDAKTSTLVMTMILGIFVGVASSKTYNLNMQGTPATIGKGRTLERKIKGVPRGKFGTLKLQLKWHSGSPLPVSNKLKVQIKYGNTTRSTTQCYSIQWSRKAPRCSLQINILEREVGNSGLWKLRVTNNSGYAARGFDIEKGSDFSPVIPFFRSTFVERMCRSATDNVKLSSGPIDIRKGTSKTVTLKWNGPSGQGFFKLKAKWHATTTFPTYNKLKIELLDRSGRAVRSGYFYSFHAPRKSPKFSIRTNGDRLRSDSSSRRRGQPKWRLKITNNSRYDIKGFDIQKGNDFNPLVPYFNSTFTKTCS